MSQEIDRKWDWIVEHEKSLPDRVIPIAVFVALNNGIASAGDNRIKLVRVKSTGTSYHSIAAQ